MDELATARAMSFQMESMTIEERVEALEQWGDDREEAGRQAALAEPVGGYHCEHGRSDSFDECELPVPRESGDAGFFYCLHHAPLHTEDTPAPEPEQPSSLVELVRRRHPTGDIELGPPPPVEDETGNVSWALSAIGYTLADIAEAIDADRVRLDNLETKTADITFPAAPEPGA